MRLREFAKELNDSMKDVQQLNLTNQQLQDKVKDLRNTTNLLGIRHFTIILSVIFKNFLTMSAF